MHQHYHHQPYSFACEVMTHKLRKLNNTLYHLNSEANACREKTIALESANVKLII